MNKEDYSISVIIPLYNNEKTILPVIDAIINQTANYYIKEIIIINDGSTDNSLKLVKGYNNRSHINIKIISQENQGVSKARNVGLNEATSTWIALDDADDRWLRDKVEKQIKILESQKNIDFLGGNFLPVDLYLFGKKVPYLYKANIKDLCYRMFPQTSTAIFRRSIIKELGGYDESKRYGEDAKFFMKICLRYNYYFMQEQLIEYGFGKRGFGEAGLSKNLKGMYEGNLNNFKELRELNAISLPYYIFIRIYFWLKYLRRIFIVKMENV